jgi:hypothetical protein
MNEPNRSVLDAIVVEQELGIGSRQKLEPSKYIEPGAHESQKLVRRAERSECSARLASTSPGTIRSFSALVARRAWRRESSFARHPFKPARS